jgi:lipopolysaccharide transport system ATP-binding protein
LTEPPIIEVRNVAKRYRLGQFNATTIQEEAAQLLRRLRRRREPEVASSASDFWALRDVSFSVNRGEVVGIIGRNGAGKSTLLKILSRITEPSSGEIRVKGRIASLLEVGTGFHPELTGRENIYLNGTILGMTRAEVKSKFDEIVEFAGVQPFLDTPVKRYSSGMHVRLAFAVAAHLEPEILVVDEVLAVGDAEFQKKCLGKMADVASGGRTVLFVSHNMDAIRRICGSAVLLSHGQVARRGGVDECIEAYMAGGAATRAESHVIDLPRPPEDRPHVFRIEVLDREGRPLPAPRTWDYVRFRLHYYSPQLVTNGSVLFMISTAGGSLLTLCSTAPDSAHQMDLQPGEGFVECDFPRLELSAGLFTLGVGLAIPNVLWLDDQFHAATLEIHQNDIFGSGAPPTATRFPVPMDHRWRIGVEAQA